MNHKPHTLPNTGFTIIELMIALTVLSVILLLATTSMMNIGNLFYKGSTVAQTQNVTRLALADISNNIMFNGTAASLINPTPTSCDPSMWCINVSSGSVSNIAYAYCLGNTRYSFIFDSQMISPPSTLTPSLINPNPTYNALWEDNPSSASANCTPLNVLQSNPELNATLPGVNGKELLLPGMQLLGFQITQNSQTNSYNIILRVAYGAPDQLLTTGAIPLQDSHCTNETGQQFCDVSTLSTTVSPRL